MGHSTLHTGKRRQEGRLQVTGDEQGPSASKLFMEGVILVGDTAVRRKEERVSFSRDFNCNKLQKGRNGECLVAGRNKGL